MLHQQKIDRIKNFIREHDYVAAEIAASQLLAANANNADVHLFNAKVRWEIGDREGLTKACEKTTAQFSKNPQILLEIAKISLSANLKQVYYDIFSRIRELDTLNIQQLADFAQLLLITGQRDEATEILKNAIQKAPHIASLWRMLALTNKTQASLEYFDALNEIWFSQKGTENQIHAGFALAQLYKKNENTKKYFRWLTLANAAVERKQDFKFEKFLKYNIKVIKKQNSLQSINISKLSPIMPIFIFGPARSGTTLLEQILGSHPLIENGDEYDYLPRILYSTLSKNKELPELKEVTTLEAEQIRARYYELTQRHYDRNHKYFIDKCMLTYRYIGYVKHIFPEAKFIHVSRDINDNALSIYENLFAPRSHQYSYNLENIGQYLAAYERIINYWKKEFPGLIFEIKYEDLTKNTKKCISPFLEKIGLSYEDRMDYFFEKNSKINTLSLAQASEPINQRSVGRSRLLEKDLRPVKKGFKKGLRNFDLLL